MTPDSGSLSAAVPPRSQVVSHLWESADAQANLIATKAAISFYTLGCKLNLSETHALEQGAAGRGYRVVPFGERADVVVINTCSVTDHADRKCAKVVREARMSHEEARVIVIGCYAQLKPETIVALPGVALVLGAGEKFALLDHVDRLVADPAPLPLALTTADVSTITSFVPAASVSDRTRAFVKVQDGCDYTCSFCTIPLARGGSRSQPVADVLAQINHLVRDEAVPEIVLTGINLGDYGLLPDQLDRIAPLRRLEHLLTLCQAIDAQGYPARFRLSSVEPNLVHDELIAFVAGSRSFVPHFHMPLQSGSDRVLALMKRRYRADLYRSRVELIRRHMPEAGIGADVIVGMPGETDEDFEQTRQLLAEVGVSYLHVFPYSERAHTAAAHMPGRMPERIRKERAQTITALSDELSAAFARQMIGQSRPTVWERVNRKGAMLGYTDNYVRVRAPYDPLIVGEIIPSRLLSFDSETGHVEAMPVSGVAHTPTPTLIDELSILS